MKEWPAILWVVLGALIALILGILGFLFWKYIAFGIWSFFKPYYAFLSALIYYILLIILFSLLDPMNIISGITWKILIIAFLVYTIKIAKKEHSKNKAKAVEILDQLYIPNNLRFGLCIMED